MERGLKSNEFFIKKKSSSGCLIIKKKIDPFSGGVGTLPRKGFGLNEERERRSFGHSVSGSSEDSLEPNRRAILPRDTRFYHGSAMYGEGNLGNNRFGQNGEFEGERKRKFEGISFGRNREFEGERRRKFEGNLGNNRFGQNGEFEGERRRKFDDVEFVENVGMYEKRMRKDDIEDRYVVRREFETESGGYGVKQNRNSSCFTASFANEASLPVSPLRQKFRVTSGKPIRVQGKNGVLKVMINKSKNAHLLRQFYDKYIEDVDRSGSISVIDTKPSVAVGASLYSGLKHSEIADSSVRMGKTEPKLQKSTSTRATCDLEANDIDLALKPKSTILVNKETNMQTTHRRYDYHQQDLVRRGSNLENDININAPVTPAFSSDSKISKKGNSLLKSEKREIKLQSSLSKRAKNNGSETEDTDSSLKREPKGEPVGSSSKGVKSEDKTPSAEKTISVSHKEAKGKRGTGTEKQLLREKIRHKLLTAGWTINYKPRKNRDYLDAVYINPAGTTYWSIIKAYEAFKKQMGEEDVPKELLNKLTRQTRQKMEKEMKMKQRENAIDKDSLAKEEAEEDAENDNNDEKISFSKKKNSKSLKRKAEKPSIDTNSRMIQERTTQKIGRCTLLVRGSDKGSKSQNDEYVPYMGKRTLLSWLIDSGTVNERAEVEYMNRKINKALLKGWIGRNGIHCGCCNHILTVSKFEIHAGSKLQQPFQNIYLENGFSLLQCLIEAWNKQDKAKRCGFHNLNIDGDDENDDACGLCGDGGDLMCCDGCPSTFHQSCIGIQTLPLGDWHCPNCTCKFCERSSAHGNALLTCRLCERKYHKSCKEEIDALSADIERDADFCGKKCQEVFNKLHKLLEVKHELEAGFSWSLIHRTDIDTDTTQHGFPQKVECNSKLAVALSVIEECFLPINDRRSGINLIHNVLYNRGSNYSRLNHTGFYTAILERGDEIIAAASIRIHGTQLAEMPFIGTRHIYRRQGMCRRLLCAIESALSSLNVGKLIIPAIAEDMHTWIGAFSFNSLKESHRKEMRSLNIMVFPRTEMLQKMLVEQNTIEKRLTAESGAKSILSKEQQRFKPKMADKTAPIDSSLRVNISNGNASSNGSLLLRDGIAEDVHQASIKVLEPIDDSSGNNLTTNVKEMKEVQDDLKPAANETDEALEQLIPEKLNEVDN